MLVFNLIAEGIAGCFILLLSCVVGIANSPAEMVFFYAKEVQERTVALGLITKERIKRNYALFTVFGIIPFFALALAAVYGINGARGFAEGFWQLTCILLIEGFFDRIFVDWYWVCRTKAWIIPGTEDLMPYIDRKTFISKWLGTLIGYPVLAALISAVMMFFVK